MSRVSRLVISACLMAMPCALAFGVSVDSTTDHAALLQSNSALRADIAALQSTTLAGTLTTTSAIANGTSEVKPQLKNGTDITNMLSWKPSEINLVNFLGMVIPSDWECQGRVDAGVFPCPSGVPSICRYYHFDLSRYFDPTQSVDPPPPADRSESPRTDPYSLTRADKCMVYYCFVLGDYEGDVALDKSCCPYFAGSWRWTEANFTAYDFQSLNSTALFQEMVADGPAQCGGIQNNGLASFFHYRTWGHSTWVVDPTVDRHFLNMDVNRFEMGPQFGISLYSSQLDVVRIHPSKQVEFLPYKSEAAITLDSTLSYTKSSSAGGRRQLHDSKGAKPKVPKMISEQCKEEASERFRGSCHQMDGCPHIGALLEHGEEAEKRRRLQSWGTYSTEDNDRMKMSAGTSNGQDPSPPPDPCATPEDEAFKAGGYNIPADASYSAGADFRVNKVTCNRFAGFWPKENNRWSLSAQHRGAVSASSCTAPGQPFSVSGCHELPPGASCAPYDESSFSEATGYKISVNTDQTDLSLRKFNVVLDGEVSQCADGYEGTVEVAICEGPGERYTFTGCTDPSGGNSWSPWGGRK